MMLNPTTWLQQGALWRKAAVFGLLFAVAGVAQATLIYELEFSGQSDRGDPIAAILQFESDQFPSSVDPSPIGPVLTFTNTYLYDSLTVYSGGRALGTDSGGIILQRGSNDPGLSDLYAIVSEPIGHGPWMTIDIVYELPDGTINIDPDSPLLTLGPITDTILFDGLFGTLAIGFEDGSVLSGTLSEVSGRVLTTTSEPTTLLLFAAGFAGAGLLARKLRRRSR